MRATATEDHTKFGKTLHDI